MKFYCVCMSPAIDATVTLNAAPKGAGEIFKDVADVENVGGKGVNVARWLAIRGAETVCVGLLGADNAAPFERELARYGIRDAFVRVPGSTRRNEMIAWPGGSMKLNRAAFPGLEQVASVAIDAAPGDVAVLSGSLPACCPPAFYADCIRDLRSRGVTAVLDTCGEPFAFGIEAGPDVVKPNADECGPVVGFVPRAPEEFARAAAALRRHVACPIISDGGAGAWFDGTFVPAPKVEVVDTTAAGDTLLAEWCYRRFVLNDPDAGRWAVAAGSAACAMPGGAPPAVAEVERLV